MAEKQQTMDRGAPQHVSGTTLILALVAAVVAGGPVLGMTGFSFLATLALLLVASPFLITFSPVVFGAACVLGFALAGFGAAAAMASASMYTFSWAFRSFVGFDAGRGRDVIDTLTESGEGVKERGKEWGGDLQQNPHEILVNRD